MFPISLAIAAQSEAQNPTNVVEFQVVGTLISTNARSALINGEVAREGERVDGVEILAIDEGEVRVLNGSQELRITVGSTVRLAPSRARPANFTRNNPNPLIYSVNSGETLSEIAEHYAGPGASLNQVMMALFDANPGAFDGNINRLRAGAELRIPPGTDIRRRTPEFAMAEVLRQTESWRSGDRPARVARLSAPAEVQLPVADAGPEDSHYGPVGYGETLSEIAVRVAGDGVTMQRMMSALFEANPQAFGDSIDLLHEGAVLRIPDVDGIEPGATLAASRR